VAAGSSDAVEIDPPLVLANLLARHHGRWLRLDGADFAEPQLSAHGRRRPPELGSGHQHAMALRRRSAIVVRSTIDKYLESVAWASSARPDSAAARRPCSGWCAVPPPCSGLALTPTIRHASELLIP